MNLQDVQFLYDYNYWATKKILAAAKRVSQEQFVTPVGHSNYGTLRGTLVHTMEAEHVWRMLFQNKPHPPDLPETEFPTFADLEQRWREEEVAMRDYLSGLTDNDLMGLVRYTTDTGIQRERVRWHCLVHVVNHGTQHRSEAAVILTSYGHSPGELDVPLFLNEQA